ncbi:MAG: SLOG family protein [Oscillospiraceae bacterium]|jgi:uncharacterized phage-like protein YoqJ|nr:SLOG family protein [Oscillospiraceae bacterium]
MDYAKKICSFTGYRTKKLNASISAGSASAEEIKSALKAEMERMLKEGFGTFQCGMAVGADLMFAEIALELKREHPSVKFIAVIPCLEHDSGWNETDRARCREISEKADEAVIVSNSRYFDGCMAKRNRYLADTCDELLAVYDGQRGGTMQTINYAGKRKIKITVVNPEKGFAAPFDAGGYFKKRAGFR